MTGRRPYRAPAVLAALLLSALLLGALACGGAETGAGPGRRGDVELRACPELGHPDLRCGVHRVWEDRAARAGRRIPIRIALLPSIGARRSPPLVLLAGGPGASAVAGAAAWAGSPWRRGRDLLFLDQRGTGGSNALACPPPDDDPQRWLEPPFSRLDEVARCREVLAARADLRLYTTELAVDDFDEVRRALGDRRVDLHGGSYGSRVALVWIRRHPGTVRVAVLDGVAPLSFENPLHHARSAQQAIDRTFSECAADAACAAAFPDLPARLDEVLARLDAAPRRVVFDDPATGRRLELELSRDGLAAGLRLAGYSLRGNRSLPRLVDLAWRGDPAPLARTAFVATRGIDSALAMGLLLSVTCAEDVARIDEGEIALESADTYLGDARVRAQVAACERWPRGEVDPRYGDPVRADLPVLLLSGTLDPVTPPEQGEAAAVHLPRSLHLVVPGAHGVGAHPCLQRVVERFLDLGALEELDTGCVRDLSLPPFDLTGTSP